MTDPVKPVEPAAPAKVVHNTVLPSDIDAQGNVILWEKTDDGVVPVTMHNSDASHALAVDPARWSIEPADADGEIEAEVAKLKEAREASKKAAQDHADAIQLAADRKVAVGIVMAARAAKAAAEKAAAPPTPPPAAPVTYVDPPVGKTAL
jgi:hypothetical protein